MNREVPEGLELYSFPASEWVVFYNERMILWYYKKTALC